MDQGGCDLYSVLCVHGSASEDVWRTSKHTHITHNVPSVHWIYTKNPNGQSAVCKIQDHFIISSALKSTMKYAEQILDRQFVCFHALKYIKCLGWTVTKRVSFLQLCHSSFCLHVHVIFVSLSFINLFNPMHPYMNE